MVVGIIHKGSGCGDQLFSYIATRVRAADLGVDFGFVGKEFFKGASFMNLDWGEPTDEEWYIHEQTGKLEIPGEEHRIFELNTPYYNPEFNFIPNGSVIDGYGAQDIRYFEHRLDEVRKWLKVEEWHGEVPDDLCILNIRGGEYRAVGELILPHVYWLKGIGMMLSKNKNMRFEIHTDDPDYCREMFGDAYPISKNIGLNWRTIRYAKHLIISNSAFAILPALLNENVKEVIAPKFWAGRNVGEWRRPGNYYKKFTYI